MTKSITMWLICCSALVSPAFLFGNDDENLHHLKAAFTLSNGEGQEVTEAVLRNSHALVAFGFTHCAHVCPMLAANMASVIKSSPVPVQGVFISVDTERDTPRITGEYAAGFGAGLLGLSGTHRQVSQAAQNFGVNFVVTKTDKSYTVEHTASTFLVGPGGDIVHVFAFGSSPKEMLETLQSLAE